LTYSFSYIFEEKNKLIKNFRKIFPFAVIPQIFMLFYAIYLRINQYDLTINRYFVLIFWLLLFIISLYFSFSKKKNLIVIPATLTLFIIIISIIPKYNVYSYPQERQLERLKNNLIEASILKLEKSWTKWLNQIIPLKNYSDISHDLSKNIYYWIEYLCEFDNCEDIKNLFPQIYNEIEIEDKKEWEQRKKEDLEYYEKYKDEYSYLNEDYKENIENKKYGWPSKWKIINWIAEKIKIDRYKEWYFNPWIPEISIYSSYYWIFPLNIKWYSEIIVAWTNHSEDFKKEKYFQINLKEKNMYYFEKWKKIETVDLKNLFKQIKNRYDEIENFKRKDFIFKINEKYTIIFENIHIPINFDEIKKDNDFSYYNSRWLIITKKSN
jgi:hypothetical protein